MEHMAKSSKYSNLFEKDQGILFFLICYLFQNWFLKIHNVEQVQYDGKSLKTVADFLILLGYGFFIKWVVSSHIIKLKGTLETIGSNFPVLQN